MTPSSLATWVQGHPDDRAGMGWLTAAMAGGCECAVGGCVPREEATEGVFPGPKPRSPSSGRGLLSPLYLVLLMKGDQGRRIRLHRRHCAKTVRGYGDPLCGNMS